MTKIDSIERLKTLSLAQIKAEVKALKKELPKDRRNRVTYSKNFTLSLSNYCQNQCGYCFYNYKIPKIGGEGNVVLLDNEPMTTLIQKGLHFNCKEALLMSGERPESFAVVQDELQKSNCTDYIEFVADICSYLLDFNLLPHTNIGLLSFEELERLKDFNASMGLMLESTSLRLFEKGQVHELSPNKKPEFRIRHIKDAGKLKIPFTTGLLLGIGETMEERIHDLLLIKQIHEEYGHIQEVIIQNFVKKPGISYQPETPITLQETLRTAGLARIVFGNEIAVQVPPNLIEGYEKEALELGVNDFGGISPFTIDYINPMHSWPQIENLTKKLEMFGYSLKERLPIYDKFISKPEFCPQNIKKPLDNINLDDADR